MVVVVVMVVLLWAFRAVTQQHLIEHEGLVLGGSSCVGHPALVQVAQDTLNAYAASAGMAAPALRVARYGMLAPAVGAAALVLHQYLRPMHPRQTARQLP